MTSDRRNNTETNKTNRKSKFNNRNSKRAEKNNIDRKINNWISSTQFDINKTKTVPACWICMCMFVSDYVSIHCAADDGSIVSLGPTIVLFFVWSLNDLTQLY